MLTLYEHPLSPYAQKVKIALYEKGIPVAAKTPNLFGATEDDFLESSPRREVPSLIDRDHRLERMLRSGGAQIVLDGMARKSIRFAVEIA